MLLLVGGYSFVHPRWVSAALTFIRSVQEFRILEGSKRKVFSIQGSFDLRKWCFFLRPASLFWSRAQPSRAETCHTSLPKTHRSFTSSLTPELSFLAWLIISCWETQEKGLDAMLGSERWRSDGHSATPGPQNGPSCSSVSPLSS